MKTKDFRVHQGNTVPSSSLDTEYIVHVRQKIATGLADIDAGRVHTHASIRSEFITGICEGFDQLDRGEGIAIDQAEKLLASWMHDRGSPNPS